MKERISQILKYSRLKNAQFADRIGMQQATVSNYILGTRQPSLDYVTNILQAFPEISAEWLMRGTGEMIPEPTRTKKNHKEPTRTTKNQQEPQRTTKDEQTELLKEIIQILKQK